MKAAPKPSRERQPYRQGLLFTLLGLLILVEVLTVFAVLASQRFATEKALRDYSHELLTNVVDETRENAAGYLRQAANSVQLAVRVLQAGLLAPDDSDRLDRYFLEQLQIVPQIDALFYGDIDGNFVFSKRDGDGYLSKRIVNERAPGERVQRLQRDAGLQTTGETFDLDDSYDPRNRPWFKQARETDGLAWTDPYIFYTSQRPGLTVARAVRGANGVMVGVVGADVELSALSQFLRAQRIGRSGAAFIVYGNGDVLAHPLDRPLAGADAAGHLRMQRLDEIDPVAATAGARLDARPGGLSELRAPVYDHFQVADSSYLGMFVPLLGQDQQHWVMGVYAAEDELTLKIREGQRESVFLGIAVSLLVVTAAIMTGLIVLRPLNALQRQAREDPLTGLLNRRGFDEMAQRRLGNLARNGQPVSALMIDIDHFKRVNDRLGHAAGDEVLQVVASRLTHDLSNADVLARYGGEEFAVILPGAALAAAERVAERLRAVVADSSVQTQAGTIDVTISIGVAQREGPKQSLSDLVHAADLRLLQAKRNGRDRVEAAA